MEKNKPTNNSIILGINKKIKYGNLNWYIINNDNSIETWRASEKITEHKAIMYTIYHNIDNPETSYLTIHLENRYNKSNSKSSDIIHIMTIKNLVNVLILLKKAIEQSGSKIFDYSAIIIENPTDDNLILLTKDKKFDKNWALPGNILKSSDRNNLIKTELKNYGIFNPDMRPIKYRNIVNYDNIYFNIIPYVINNFEGDEITKNHIWVDKRDISNYHIGPESRKVINFYRKDGLPF